MENLIENQKKKKECNLSMIWYNFFYKIRLPIGIVLGILAILNYLLGIINEDLDPNILLAIVLMLETVILIYDFYIIDIMKNRKENGFNYICYLLGFETFGITLTSMMQNTNLDITINFIISLIFPLLIWFLPNYIYFQKRKCIFEYEEKTEKIKQQEQNEIDNLDRIINSLTQENNSKEV